MLNDKEVRKELKLAGINIPDETVFLACLHNTSIDEISNQKYSQTYKAESLLVGVGYGSREIGRRLSYITVMIDLAENINSPYRDGYNRAQPIIRTGFGFYLKPSRK